MPDSIDYEVRCERCKTTFAAGTKQCVHCGGALGRRRLGLGALSGGGMVTPGSAQREPAAPDAQPALGRIFRVAMIGLVVVTAFARTCMEQN